MDSRDETCCQNAIASGKKALAYYQQAGPDWAKNDMAFDAIHKRIEDFAEQVGKMSDELQAAHPEFPFARIRKTRNVLAHDYAHVRVQFIQEALDIHLPANVSALEQWLASS